MKNALLVLILGLLASPPVWAANGLTCSEIFAISSARQRRLTPDEIVAAIQVLATQNVPLNTGTIQRNTEANPSLTSITGFAFNAAKVYKDAVVFHGLAWDTWLTRSGVDVAAVKARAAAAISQGRPRKFQINASQVLVAIQALTRARISVFASDVQHSWNDPTATAVIFKAIGLEMSPAHLYRYATLFLNQKWTWWLSKAGLNETIKQRQYSGRPHLTPDEVVIAIQIMAKNGTALNTTSIHLNNEASPLLSAYFESQLAPSQVYYDAVSFHQVPWRQWLERAGLDPDKILVRAPLPRPLTPTEIVDALKFLDEQGVALNSGAIQRNRYDSVINELLSLRIGLDLSPALIFKHAVATGRSWDAWLLEAGFNPNEIRKRGFVAIENLSKAMQAELRSNYGVWAQGGSAFGDVKNGEISETVVVDRSRPDLIVEQTEKVDRLYQVADSLVTREQVLVDGLLDYFSKNSDPELTAIQDYFASHLEMEVSPQEIAQLFVKLRSDSRLTDLFED